MKDTRFIKTIRLRNLLSFGPESEEIELKPLNVLIGPNASGKSNFVDVISILQATPRDISEPMRQGGGIKEWLWKGPGKEYCSIIETILMIPCGLKGIIPLRYRISFEIFAKQININEEIIEKEKISNKNKDIFYRYSLNPQVLELI